MTEAEWLACIDPQGMLEQVRQTASERKVRLFTVAWLRQLSSLLTHPASRRAVEVAERFADRLADAEELDRACEEADAVLHSRESPPQLGKGTAWWEGARLAHWACVEEAVEGADEAILSSSGMGVEEPEKLQAHLLRCIIDNPFRPITTNLAWLSWHDGLLVSIARQMYDSRDFTDMPVMADALEEAGCTDQDILSHCRGPGPHVRGCWVVDLILGKE
jgi:hypothetical protein